MYEMAGMLLGLRWSSWRRYAERPKSTGEWDTLGKDMDVLGSIFFDPIHPNPASDGPYPAQPTEQVKRQTESLQIFHRI